MPRPGQGPIRWLLWGSLWACGGGPGEGEAAGRCPPGGTDATWDNHGRLFVETWCTSCHHADLPAERRQGAPLGVDFDRYEGVLQWSDRIVERAVDRPWTMPPAGGPSAEARALMGEWIACGLPGGTTLPAPACAGTGSERAGDLVVDAAADLDTFCVEHDRIGGSLRIGGTDPIALDCLCAVGGDLVVEAGSGLAQLRLPNLAEVGGEVRVEQTGLVELDLGRLVTVGGGLWVEDNANLLQAPLDDLESVGGDLRLRGNPLLDEARLGRLFTVGGTAEIAANALLGAVHLDRIQAVGGDLILAENPLLGVIYGDAYALQTVGGDLVLRANPSLEGFYGFIELVEVGGDLVLEDDDGFETFFGFTRLERVGGDLRIAGHARLGLVDGFDFLESVGGSLVIEDNAVMRYVLGYRVLDRVGAGTGGALRLADLPDLEGIAGLATARTLGALQIERTGLRALDDLHGLTAIEGDLRVVGNSALPAAEVDRLVAAIGAENIGGTVTNSGNAP